MSLRRPLPQLCTMVRHNTCLMSMPSVSANSQLPATWSPHYTCADVSTMAPGYTGRLWTQETPPQFWSKFQVWEWLQQTLDMHQIDATSIPFHNFDMDGRQLCSMSFQDFTRAAGSVGPLLYQSLTDLKWSGGAEFSCSLLPFKEESYFYSTSPSDLYDMKQSFPTTTTGISSIPASPVSDWLLPNLHPSGPDPRGTHLWEFIRDILLHPERNPGLIKWEDRAEGIFRFLKSEAVAQLWGKKKNNSSMTYEKLSRAMRYYYKREILERVDGRRLVYKFGRNARGWRESDK
ncbi:ETS-like factor-like [Scleropages formosus]|uniref:ETS homologous factor n=1 Tax=Scleropages formosus TaxID=113540 RepID=A0A0P7UKG4_SCLFO|nr:ETS-like factor-like [Scleropages formosus]